MTRAVGAHRRPAPASPDASGLPALAARVAAGDRTAFAAFYDILAPRMLRLIVAVVGDEALACDVTRDVFGDMWVQASRCPTDADGPLVWAMGIAYQHAQHHAQTDRRGRVGAGDRSGGNANTVAGDLKGLTAGQHAAITLSYYGALTWDRTARATAVPPHTIARAQRDALIRLRDMAATSAGDRSVGRPSPFPRRERQQPSPCPADTTRT